MSFEQIEAELEHLSPEELRCLALKSWAAFVQREECSNVDVNRGDEAETAITQADSQQAKGIAGLRDHSAFLNSYVPADDGLYDDAASR